MKSKFGVVEIGSTNTKAYKYNIGAIYELGFKTIEFKKNYNAGGIVLESDLNILTEYINSVFGDVNEIHVYATSVFREMTPDEIDNLTRFISEKTNVVEFKVVTPEMENKYTVIGAISDIKITENICVFVGGGGSTEISICKNGEIEEMTNSNIGVGDIMKVFPDLADDFAITSIDIVTEYISHRLKKPSLKADFMILAGGDFLLRYNNAKYPTVPNTYFESHNHPLTISIEDNRAFEEDYYHKISLDKLKETTPNNPKWWNGTRAMCAFTNSVALAIDAKIIVPTRISMIYGIIADISITK